MPNREQWKQQDEETEAELRSIIANPDIAKEAFPDEERRAKIVPFIQYLRRRVETGSEK